MLNVPAESLRFADCAAIAPDGRRVSLEEIVLFSRDHDQKELMCAESFASQAAVMSYGTHIAKVREKSLILTVKDLAIDGQTLMKELLLKPGPQLGEILRDLLEKVVDDPGLNEQEKLLALAKEHVRRSSQEKSSS